ncbi:helix-turn-helix domain-containing protein [Actinosynnema sp. CS-041913]|uniref:helix-turn-helix domain-containing protein n=1 Tax=Actinosynnema sp. CS-041913 TaxID=3239917 RepID=UPI003D9340D3
MVQQLDWRQIGGRIRAARTLCKLSQDQVAARLGIDRTGVMRMESGARKVSALDLARLAELFEVPLGYFVHSPLAAVVSRRAAVVDEPDAAAREVWRLDIALEAHARDVAWLAQADLLPAAAVPDWPREELATVAAAQAFAQRVRRAMGAPEGPLGPLADVCAYWGLHMLVVHRDADGASVQVDEAPGHGASVIGDQADPGRRRFTAAHELGHHLLQDPYSSDVGVGASRDERERLINAFAQELLLPGDDLRGALAAEGAGDPWPTLVRVAARYRVSWSLVVRTAKEHGLIDAASGSTLAARKPVHGDFLSVLGSAPAVDLSLGTTSAVWKQSVLSAYQRALITGVRALEMLHGAVESVADLPTRTGVDRPL